MNQLPAFDIDRLIAQRQTTKVLAQDELPPDRLVEEALDALVAAAGWAPFHRPCDASHRQMPGDPGGIEPWRLYVLDAPNCRRLRSDVVGMPEAGKIPAMLAAASGLVLATWLPNPAATELPAGWLFEPTLGNMEHIAAASAAIQNLLLAATARAIPNYWSSGGVLRSPEIFDRLGIPRTQILLGAVFLFPTDVGSAEVVGSKLRSSRTPPAKWSRRIQLV